jgi:hypothetical protein
LLGGLTFLFWKNVLEPRLVVDGKSQELVQAPAPPVIPPTPPVVTPPKKDDEPPKVKPPVTTPPGTDVDIADLKGPEKPAPPPILNNPPVKPPVEEEPKIPVKPDPPVVVPVVVAPPTTAAGVTAKGVDAAISRGVAYLKGHQSPDGSWNSNNLHPVGYASLAGLTLLECQVPANEPVVQKAAQFVRGNLANLNQTYELTTALLFLDRLGDSKDRVVIQGIALRLLAGQNSSGGWSYNCPLLSVAEMQQLDTYLQSHRPDRSMNKPAKAGGNFGDKPMPAAANLVQPQIGPNVIGPPIMGLGDLMAVELPPAKGPVGGPTTGPFLPSGQKAPPPNKDPKRLKPISPNQLMPQLQNLPVVALSWNKGWLTSPSGSGDHSNTQFALLALWAARRHDVPVEYSLLVSYQRFVRVQAADGGWGYKIGEPTKNTMTCVGLLGLAMGRGAIPAAADERDKLEEPSIQSGLDCLSRFVGSPSTDPEAKPPIQNLYLLWSIERVAMLYDLKTIGGRDWYGWGAQMLLANQQADGHWTCGTQYDEASSHTDTCFALLFLKRSNLVADLTESLRLRMVIRDSGSR